MQLTHATVVITGAKRGPGKAFVEALLARGVGRIYAGVRTACSFADKRIMPVKLDVTNISDIARAVEQCGDASVVINNAGIMRSSPVMASDAGKALREEMAVNAFGLHAMIQAFAPVLKLNGGGWILNMLSVASWFTSPWPFRMRRVLSCHRREPRLPACMRDLPTRK